MIATTDDDLGGLFEREPGRQNATPGSADLDDAEPRPITDPAAYARRALDRAVENITAATEGVRNHTLNAAAYSLGRLVEAKLLEEDSARDCLRTAAQEVGLSSVEIEKTIESGLRAGALRPFAWVQSEPVRPPKATPFVPDAERRPYQHVSLADVMAGTMQRPVPTVGRRNDDRRLFYARRVNTVFGETESGKTMFMTWVAAQEIALGHNVMYLDFEEDNEAEVGGRLRAFAASAQDVEDHFRYFLPNGIFDERGRLDFGEYLDDMQPTLAVIDGVTEAMALHGLTLMENIDIVKFAELMPRWIARKGPAVVVLDHVVKDPQGRGRYPIGGVAKLNGMTGVAFMLEPVKALVAGSTGRSRLRIAKDRPGEVRRYAVPGGDQQAWAGDFILDAMDPVGRLLGELEAPIFAQPGSTSCALRPETLMTNISAFLIDEASLGREQSSQSTILSGVTGSSYQDKKTAIRLLAAEGFVKITRAGRGALMHRSIKPYPEAQ